LPEDNRWPAPAGTQKGRVTRRSWVAATALFLSVVTAAIGSVPNDAIAGIPSMGQTSGLPGQEDGPAMSRATADSAQILQEVASARYPMWMIMLIVILLVLIWLIYRTLTGWNPLILGG